MRSSSPQPLPIDDVLPEIVAALREHPSAVLRAPAGAGKTTRVPPALLDAGLAGDGRVLLLEPRRVAARAAARRIAEERGSELGDQIGYQMRFERRASAATRLLVVTQGILLAFLQRDPFLDGIGAVIFDEVHERNLENDLALAMCRRVQREARPDLRLLAMSATLETGLFADYLGADSAPCPVIESDGRLFPVDIRHLETPPTPDRRPRIDAEVVAGVRRVLRETSGDVLAFLPGVGEIRRAAERLGDLNEVDIRPLYGDLPAEAQDLALTRGRRRKVVLATNVAETSVTVDGVEAVVDSGWAREMRFDPSSGLDRLELRRISRASADQRAGRAGRQGPGLCLRLWSRHDDRSLAAESVPEIRRVDLAGPALQLLAWGESDLAAFDWLEPPTAEALDHALDLLALLGARDAHGLTRVGRAMARLPVHPRLARLLTAGAELGVLERTALAAALLSERDVFERQAFQGYPHDDPPPTSPSDILDRVEALERFARGGRVDTPRGPLHRGRAHRVGRAARRLADLARRHLDGADLDAARTESAGDRDEALLRALLDAWPDRVARRRAPGEERAVMVGGRGVRLQASSAVRDAELFLAIDLDGAGGEARVRMASVVERRWLDGALRTADEVVFDNERRRAVGLRRTWYRDLLLDQREVPPSPAEVEGALARAAADDLEHAVPFENDDLASFLARLRSLARWMPELDLPTFEDSALRELLPILCPGRRSFAELRRAPWLDTLRGLLTAPQLAALERHAPERLPVPSGSLLRLRYEPGEPPVLEARIQEMFGLAETPRVAAGRVAVLLHLLAPNRRPQQITDDLESFWNRTYPEVRKELRARYPRHAWPEDPWNASPERRPASRRRSK